MGNKSWLKYPALVSVNLIYACTSIFTKSASMCEFLSLRYMIYFACAVAVLGVYAILWQQVIKRLPISEAYMFKGTSIIFVMILSALLFAEQITVMNIVGAVIIVSGIALYSRV